MPRLLFILTTVLASAGLAGAALAQDSRNTEKPHDRTLRPGQIVYVDDGTCPAGEIKEITGGSKDKSMPRKTRCIKRSEAPGG